MVKKELDDRWSSVFELINNANRIVCSTHVNPDGDGIGSQLAIGNYLKEIGKELRILNPSPLPEEYCFLMDVANFEQYNRSIHTNWIHKADLAILLDIGDIKRLNQLGDDIQTFQIPTLSIDHHPHQTPNGFSYYIHDISVCSTGYLIYEFIKYANKRWGINHKIAPEVAQGLYIAVMTDTGSFRFSNTSAESHMMASELIKCGVQPYDVYQRVYETNTLEKMRLMGVALSGVRIDGDGKLAWFTVTRDMIKNSGATHKDVSGFTDIVRSIRGVEVTVMIHELGDNQCKANFRSKGNIRIDDLARELGGGGHPFAAGVIIDLPIKKATELVVSKTLSVIQSQLYKIRE